MEDVMAVVDDIFQSIGKTLRLACLAGWILTAENLGEYGYPERGAAAVTTAALSWLAEIPPSVSLYMWVHYYDPHAPYNPPGAGGGEPRDRYAREVAFMDREIGRLLAAVAARGGETLVAAGTSSAAVRLRLGQLAAKAGEGQAAVDHLEVAVELAHRR
jgi:hypothetical protein